MTLQERMHAVAEYWKSQPRVRRPPVHHDKPYSYECNCDGAGWFMLMIGDGRYQLTKCSCGVAGQSPQAQRLSRELDVLQNRTFENYHVDRVYVDLPDASASTQKTLVSIAYAKARKYADKPSGWLYIYGRPGTGKSHLAAAIANVNKNHMNVIYRSMPSLIDLIRENANQLDALSTQIADADLVIIDDIGADGRPTEWAEARIFTIINNRVDKPTVFTSNYDVADLPYSAHIIDRLNASRRCWINTTSMRGNHAD
jgi:DNA replication protein DnaC